MKIQINTQKREENKIREVKIKSSLLVASFVFSMSLITLLLFFASSQAPREIDYQEDSEIKEVFKETGIYDLQGRKAENPTTGIYIINGKKMLVK